MTDLIQIVITLDQETGAVQVGVAPERVVGNKVILMGMLGVASQVIGDSIERAQEPRQPNIHLPKFNGNIN